MKALEIVKRFFKDERGLETVEYAVMTALIIFGAILTLGLLASAVSDKFSEVATVVSTGAVPAP